MNWPVATKIQVSCQILQAGGMASQQIFLLICPMAICKKNVKLATKKSILLKILKIRNNFVIPLVYWPTGSLLACSNWASEQYLAEWNDLSFCGHFCRWIRNGSKVALASRNYTNGKRGFSPPLQYLQLVLYPGAAIQKKIDIYFNSFQAKLSESRIVRSRRGGTLKKMV